MKYLFYKLKKYGSDSELMWLDFKGRLGQGCDLDGRLGLGV